MSDRSRSYRDGFMLYSVLLVVAVCAAATCRQVKAADHPWYASYRVEFQGGAGSATAIGEHLVLTNWHVAGAPGRAGTARNAHGESWVIRCMVSNQTYDLAICETSPQAKPLKWAAIADTAPAGGEEVQFYGYGAGEQPLRMSKGEFLGQEHGQNYWSAIVQSGDSGGGFFNAAGRLIGVNARTDNAYPPATGGYYQGQSLSVPLVQVKDFLGTYTTQCQNGSCQMGGGGSQPSRRPPPKNWPQPAPEPTPDVPVVPVPPKAEPPAPPVAPVPQPAPILGKDGKDGAQGPQGPPGPAYDDSKLLAAIDGLQASIVSLQAQPAKTDPAIAARLDNLEKPITTEIVDANGKVLQSTEVKLGGKLRFQLIPKNQHVQTK